jgi:hypothetical protein
VHLRTPQDPLAHRTMSENQNSKHLPALAKAATSTP